MNDGQKIPSLNVHKLSNIEDRICNLSYGGGGQKLSIHMEYKSKFHAISSRKLLKNQHATYTAGGVLLTISRMRMPAGSGSGSLCAYAMARMWCSMANNIAMYLL